jgi:RNA polymerase sigma-70 factor (ECF subfamily)
MPREKCNVTATPISLLERLRLRPDADAWQRLVDLYAPLVGGWLRALGLQPADAEDLTQEALATLVRELPGFRHNLRTGAFRRWLRGIVLNRLRVFRRARQPIPAACHPSLERALDLLEEEGSDLSRSWDEEHDRHVVRRVLELIEPEFEPASWRAFCMIVLEGKATREAASALGMSPNAVRIAKSRVLARFRQEIAGLID